MPTEISEPIRFHHAPERAQQVKDHVAVVALADAMVGVSGSKMEDNPDLFKDLGPSLEQLGIDSEIAEAMLDKYLSRHASAVQDAFG